MNERTFTFEYASYLVRIWEGGGAAAADDARVEVESIQTGERWLFSDRAAAMEFLRRRAPPNVAEATASGRQPAEDAPQHDSSLDSPAGPTEESEAP